MADLSSVLDFDVVDLCGSLNIPKTRTGPIGRYCKMVCVDHVPKLCHAPEATGLIFLHEDHTTRGQITMRVLVKISMGLPILIYSQPLIVGIAGAFKIVRWIGHYEIKLLGRQATDRIARVKTHSILTLVLPASLIYALTQAGVPILKRDMITEAMCQKAKANKARTRAPFQTARPAPMISRGQDVPILLTKPGTATIILAVMAD